ncbi:Ku protein [Streptomyces sp. CC228A]|uniref:non-homologous end joining protein Ku n=1 Tax=Streptomyces sp. CC228A TaxID=2898186 RepID=UPI001F22746A|nr:Ku protein [Streptomyces sp. CC228A]
MRSIWNGAISFGLVSIPIKLVNATENRSISFRQIHTEDGGRIRYRKVCELDGQEVTAAEIGKAYEEADGTMIPITDEDLAALPLPTAKTIEIVAFVPASQIDPLQMDAAYYLQANGVPAAKPYTLLREALKRSDRVAIAKYALRGRERLGMLRVVDDVIAMHGLLWPDEIRRPEGVAPETPVTVRDAELDLADALMDTLGSVDIGELHDDYRTAVEELIAAKAEGAVAPPEPGPERGAQVIDLMAALESSVRAAREARGEEAAGEEVARAAEASVTDLPSRSRRTPPRAPAAPKAAGGRKSATAEAPGGRARKAASKTASAPASKTKEGAAADKAAVKKAAAAKTAAADKTAAKKTAAAKTAAKKTVAKKATAGRGAARKRSA